MNRLAEDLTAVCLENNSYHRKGKVSQMKKQAGIRLGAVAGSICVFAITFTSQAEFSADTVAFYPFTDQVSGSSATTGDTVANAVDGETFPGTLKTCQYNSSYPGTVTFTNDVPGRYVYSDWYATNLLAEIQGIHMHSNGLTGTTPDLRPGWSGGCIIFPDLAQELMDSGDYTIEYFWKIGPGMDSSCQFLYYPTCDAITEILYGSDSAYVRGGVNSRNGKLYTSDRYDVSTERTWHHLAQVYDAQTKTLTVYTDYTASKTSDPLPGTLPADIYRPVILGADAAATNAANSSATPAHDCTFAAPRFTRRKLDPKEFMVAFSRPVTPMIQGETVFSWPFNGPKDGDLASVTYVTNRIVAIDPETEKANQYAFSKGRSPGGLFPLLGYTGCATSFADAGATSPVFRVESGRRKRVLKSGADVVDAQNLGMLELIPSARESGTYMAMGEGVSWAPNEATRVSGAFTLEGFVRLDAVGWQSKVLDVMEKHGETRWRTTIFGLETTREENVTCGVFHLRSDIPQDKPASFLIRYYDAVNGKEESFSCGALDADDFAGKLHHFAVTYDPPTRTIAVYIDYRQTEIRTLDVPLDIESSGCWAAGHGFNNCSFPGWFDEMRLTRKVLEPSEFLKMTSDSGLMLIFR